MNVWLIHHGGTYNRGCEAIVRTTTPLIRRLYPQARITLWSGTPRTDRRRLGALQLRIASQSRRWSAWKMPLQLCKLLPGQSGARLSKAWFKMLPGSPDVVLSIGGDNYTLECGGHTPAFQSMDMPFLLTPVPFVIWAASIGPFEQEPGAVETMRRFLSKADLITAREPLTARYLKELLSPEVRTCEVCDPAFLLNPAPCDSPATAFVERHRPVGLNASALSSRVAGKQPGDICGTLAGFIRRLVTEGRHVLLVPHVYGDGCPDWNDDRDYLAQVAAAAAVPADHLHLVREELGAEALKGLIAQCDTFIGARTHATIAALSSCVPTLSLSYSLKSRGINRDLFGHEDFVLPVADTSVDSLYACWHHLQVSRKEVANHLRDVQERIRAGANRNVDALADLLQQHPHLT